MQSSLRNNVAREESHFPELIVIFRLDTVDLGVYKDISRIINILMLVPITVKCLDESGLCFQ